MNDALADHPGMTEPGRPGVMRYICPFCRWYLDDPAVLDGPACAVSVPPVKGESFPEMVARYVRFVVDTHIAALEDVLQRHIDSHVDEMVAP